SRPADSAATPSSPAVVSPAGGRRPLRQIVRGAAPADANAGDGRRIHRIQRAGEATPDAATGGMHDPTMVGSWSRADSAGVIDGFELSADGQATIHLRGGADRVGRWSSDGEESRMFFRGPEGGEVQFVVWTGGPGLRGAVITAAGPRRTLAFRRAPDGPVRQPAVRQP
ncbi:MAG TPA: hypothetical protein VFI13_05830, partial [Gemmatimonadales bacterium]|nr:hypothetical protein [Gemmatimonadales bacterium]